MDTVFAALAYCAPTIGGILGIGGTVLLIALVIAVVTKIRNTIRRNSDAIALGKAVLDRARKEGLDGYEEPKTPSSANSLYLPQIKKDFPDFSWEEQRSRAFVVLKAYLLAMGQHDESLLPDYVNETLRNEVRLSIADDEAGGVRTCYDDVKVHGVAIMRYIKEPGRCTVILNATAGFKSWKEKDGELFLGSRDHVCQRRFTIELVYIQDPDMVESDDERGLNLNCPNCGGPIRSLGQKVCEYCGTGIVEYNIKVWNFGAIKEL